MQAASLCGGKYGFKDQSTLRATGPASPSDGVDHHCELGAPVPDDYPQALLCKLQVRLDKSCLWNTLETWWSQLFLAEGGYESLLLKSVGIAPLWS